LFDAKPETSMGKKILVVEDDFDTRYVLSLVLQTEGYDVVTAADGECGFAVAVEEQPDLIVTDIALPGMNGIEMMKRMKSRLETSKIPVFAITAYGPNKISSALAAGACLCLPKPLEFEALLNAVRTLLQ
jgi:CheY-like chemotaxis protein